MHIAEYNACLTVSNVAQATPTQKSRDLSLEVFRREFQLEVAAAAAGLDAGFVVEDLHEEARRRAKAAGLDPPKDSAVRKNLKKLVAAGAVAMLPPDRPGTPGYYSPAGDSAFWPFALELYERA